MALLRAVKVGHPDAWPVARHHLSDDRRGAAVAHGMYHNLIVLEHPIPMRAPVDAHRGLVGADDARTAQPDEDGRDLVVEARLGPPQHRIQRALADPQLIEVQEQLRQPAVTDCMGGSGGRRQGRCRGTSHQPHRRFVAVADDLSTGPKARVIRRVVVIGTSFRSYRRRLQRHQTSAIPAAVAMRP